MTEATGREPAAAAAAAVRCAAAAALRSGVVISEVRDIPRIEAACALLTRIWGNPAALPVIEPHIVRAFVLSGEQVLAAYEADHPGDPGHMVGASIAWFGRDDAGDHLHSHITGVAPGLQGRDIGFALKQQQRSWALDRGITTIRWTFDPLIRRNAFFNICKLGAIADAFHINLYGAMTDATNLGDESDRFEVSWSLADPRVAEVAAGTEVDLHFDDLRALDAAVVLDEGDDGRPVESQATSSVLLARVPADVLRMRAQEPALARSWRYAARDVLGGALADRFAATGMTRSGWYVLTRHEGTAG